MNTLMDKASHQPRPQMAGAALAGKGHAYRRKLKAYFQVPDPSNNVFGTKVDCPWYGELHGRGQQRQWRPEENEACAGVQEKDDVDCELPHPLHCTAPVLAPRSFGRIIFEGAAGILQIEELTPEGGSKNTWPVALCSPRQQPLCTGC
jgi:hypothetical protein